MHVVDATDSVIAEVPGCDGLTIDLRALWAEIDALGPEDEGR